MLISFHQLHWIVLNARTLLSKVRAYTRPTPMLHEPLALYPLTVSEASGKQVETTH